MSDSPGGPGWWMASDLKWYPPAETGLTEQPAERRFAPPIAGVAGDATELGGRPQVDNALRAAPPLATPSGRPKKAKVMVAIGIVALVAAAAAAFVLGEASTKDETSGATTTTTAPTETTAAPPTSTTVSAPSPTVVGPTLEAQLQTTAGAAGALLAMAVVDTPAGPVGATLLSDENEIDSGSGRVRLWRREGDSWVEMSAISSSAPMSSWAVTDLTGDGVNDLLIESFAGNDVVGSVLSNHGGEWRMIPFASPDGDNELVEALRLDAAGLVSSSNPCVPSCADGGVIDTIWRFDDASGRFVS